MLLYSNRNSFLSLFELGDESPLLLFLLPGSLVSPNTTRTWTTWAALRGRRFWAVRGASPSSATSSPRSGITSSASRSRDSVPQDVTLTRSFSHFWQHRHDVSTSIRWSTVITVFELSENHAIPSLPKWLHLSWEETPQLSGAVVCNHGTPAYAILTCWCPACRCIYCLLVQAPRLPRRYSAAFNDELFYTYIVLWDLMRF